MRGSVLDLDGGNDYIDLPDDLAHLRTIATWVKLAGYHPWERIFDIGIDTDHFCFLSSTGSNGKPLFSIYSKGLGGGRTIEAPDPLPLNTWIHVAAVFDGPQVVLYIDGEAVAAHHSVNLLPSDLGAYNNYLGRSQFAADPYFSGRMDSTLIASRALELSQFLPMPISGSWNGNNLTLSWPATSDGRTMHQTPALENPTAWTPVGGTPSTTNGMHLLTTPATGTSGFYHLQWP